MGYRATGCGAWARKIVFAAALVTLDVVMLDVVAQTQTCPDEPCQDCSFGYLANPSFSCSDCWEKVALNGNTVVFEQSKRYKVVVTPGGANVDETYRAQVLQRRHCSYSLAQGTVYTLRFRNWATAAGRSVIVQLALKDEPNTFAMLIDAARFDLTTSSNNWHEYTFRTPIVDGRVPPVPWVGGNRYFEVSFNYAHNDGTFYLDDVTLTATPTLTLGSTTLTPFDFSTDEAWLEGTIGGGKVKASQSTNGKLSVTVNPEQARFLYRPQPLNLPFDASTLPPASGPDAPWLMKLYVNVPQNPQNVGRIYVSARSDSGQYMIASRSGLRQGANVIDFRPTDFYRAPDTQSFCWGPGSPPSTCTKGTHTFGIKVEANANGTAVVELDTLEVVPDPSPGLGRAAAAPAISYVNVVPATSSATFTWRTNKPIDLVDSGVRCGASPTSYGASVREIGTGSATSHSVVVPSLQPETAYHCVVLADDDDSSDGDPGEARSGDFVFTTEPLQPWSAPDPVAAVPFGITVGSDPSDIDVAVDAGFNRVHSFMLGGCSNACPGDPGDDNDAAYQARATPFLSRASEKGVKALLVSFCSPCILGGTTPDPLPPLPMQSSDCVSGAGEVIREHVKKRAEFLKQFPAMGGYYVWDEPPVGDTQLKARLDYVSARMRVCDDVAQDVNLRPMFIGVPTPNDFNAPSLRPTPPYPFLDTLDRALTGYYPLPDRTPEAMIPSLDAAATVGKPYELALQAYQKDTDHQWPPDVFGSTPFPSSTDLRHMAYLGLGHGSDGLWTFAMTSILPYPGTDWFWANLTSLAREVRRFGPALRAGTPLGGCVTATPSSSQMSVDLSLVRTYRGRVYIVSRHSINSGTPTGTVTYNLGPACTGLADALGESENSVPQSNAFQMSFTPGVHIYKVFTSTAPDVLITSPNNGYQVQACTDVPVTAYADDDVAVTKVQFKRNGVLMSEDTTAPFSADILIDAGSNSLQAVAWDGANQTTTSTITVTGTGFPPHYACP